MYSQDSNDLKSSAEMYELYQSIYSSSEDSEVENLSEEVDIDEARLGEPGTRLRSASERTRRTQTSAQRRAQERERGIRRAGENVLADIQALAKGKKETNSSSDNSNSSASTSSVKVRKLKTGQKKDTLAAKASDILSQIRNEENEIDEARVRKIDKPTKDDLEAVKDMPLSHKARMAKNQKAIEDMKRMKNPIIRFVESNKLSGKEQIDAMNRRLRGEELEIDEAKKSCKNKKAKRWWDDDGDGIGWEKGEVDGKFKKEEVENTYRDILISYLLDEGYAETPEAAEVIMINMSEDWINNILKS